MKTEDDTQVRDSFVPRFIWFIFSPETKKWLTKLIASRPLKTLLGRRRFHRSASLFLFSSVLLICCFGAIEHAHMHSCGASSGAGGIGCSLISLSAREEVRLRNAFPSPAFSGNQPTQRLTIVILYYDQPSVLLELLEWYASFPRLLRDLMAVMVVDDGSPNATAGAALGAVESNSRSEVLPERWIMLRRRLALDVWRIGIDVPWNQPEANNLAFSKSRTEWICRTDIDHFFEPSQVARMLLLLEEKGPESAEVFTFSRRFGSLLTPSSSSWWRSRIWPFLKPHPNTFLLTKKTYWQAGGYDESFSGNYGYDDIDFRSRLPQPPVNSGIVVRGDLRSESSTKRLDRDNTVNALLFQTEHEMKTFQHEDKYQFITSTWQAGYFGDENRRVVLGCDDENANMSQSDQGRFARGCEEDERAGDALR